LWNPDSSNIEIFGSHEFYDGRKDYAEIGGCYYAARLATNELLNKERKQAAVVIMREAHPGYIMPVGVWNVRESVRRALKTEPLKFPSLDECLTHVSKVMDIPVSTWLENSEVIKNTVQQKRLVDFVKMRKLK
jgi:hypothetical protein